MYPLKPPAVYLSEHLAADARAVRRADGMVAALGLGAKARSLADADLPAAIAEHGWQHARGRQGLTAGHFDPSLVFTTWRPGPHPEVEGLLAQCPSGTPRWLLGTLLGIGGRGIHREQPEHHRICRERYQYDTLYGCPHGCRYCPAGSVAALFCNLEEFLDREVAPTAAQFPRQKVFMFNSCASDTLCFEPEYGLSRLMAEFFAGTKDQYYLIHTKSANVGFLREVDHRGRTIVVWSLTSPTVSRQIEPGSATTEERIEAARQAQEAGCTVRFKLKPIIPVKGWRDELRHTIDLLFQKVRPDNIGMCTIAWMDGASMEACLDPELLDPDVLRAVRERAEEMKGVHTGPLPPETRAAIYDFCVDEIQRHDRQVPVFLSTESPEMWSRFAPRLGMKANDYVCACGPQCIPGAQRLQSLWKPA